MENFSTETEGIPCLRNGTGSSKNQVGNEKSAFKYFECANTSLCKNNCDDEKRQKGPKQKKLNNGATKKTHVVVHKQCDHGYCEEETWM